MEVVHGGAGGMCRRERVFAFACGVGGVGERVVQVAHPRLRGLWLWPFYSLLEFHYKSMILF
jgi:hypothetical protein